MNDDKRRSPGTANIVKAACKLVGVIFHCVAEGRPLPILFYSTARQNHPSAGANLCACWEGTSRTSVAFLENTLLPCGRERGREGNSTDMAVTPLNSKHGRSL